MNPYRRCLALTVCASLLFAAPHPARAAVEVKAIIGNVYPDVEVEDWTVEVTPEVNGERKANFYSNGSTYFYWAEPDAAITFIFKRPGFWIGSTPLDVTANLACCPHWMAPDVTLNFIRPDDDQANLSPVSGSLRDVVAHHPQETEARARLRAKLAEQAQLAKRSGSSDIFQYNLEVVGDVNRNRPALQEELTSFKADRNFADVTKAPEGRAELYRKMVQRGRGEAVEIQSESLIKLAEDSSVSPSLRARSVNEMTDQASIEFLRRKSNDQSSDLHIPALRQLIKVGTDEDRNKILKDLEGPDIKRSVSILRAMEGTQWKGGQAAVNRLSTSTQLQSTVRDAAKQTAIKLDQEGTKRSRRMVQLGGPLKGSPADFAYRERRGQAKEFQLTFRNLRPAPGVAAYVLWAIVDNRRFVRLGQASNVSNQRARIYTETSLPTFSLRLTAEKSELVQKPSADVVVEIKVP